MPFSPLLENFVGVLSFAFLMKQDRTRSKWPRCMLWNGWLPGLTARPTGSPWAVAASDLTSHNLEKFLGPIPSALTLFGSLFGTKMIFKIWHTP